MGAKNKNNPPRKRGPKPATQGMPGKWGSGKGLQKPAGKSNWAQPPNKKGRGAR